MSDFMTKMTKNHKLLLKENRLVKKKLREREARVLDL